MQSQPIPQIPPNHSSDNAPSKTTPRRQGLLVAARWPPAQRASLKPYSWQECNHIPSLKSPQITVQTMPPSKTTPRRQGLLVAARWPPAQRASLKPYSWQECNHSPSLKSPQITVQTTPPSKTTPRRQGLLVAARWPPAQRASLKPYSWQECNHSPSLTNHSSNPSRGFSWPPWPPPKSLVAGMQSDSAIRPPPPHRPLPPNPRSSPPDPCSPPPTSLLLLRGATRDTKK